MPPADAGAVRQLRAALGDALANAGRGAEAARAYLEAAEGATVAEALELRRRAALQYLISGHIDEGLAALRSVLGAVGMRLPATPRGALLSLLWRRAAAAAPRARLPAARPQRDLRGRPDPHRRLLVGRDRPERRRLRSAGPTFSPVASCWPSAPASARGSPARWRWRRPTARPAGCAAALVRPACWRLPSSSPGRSTIAYPRGMVALARGVATYLEGDWNEAHVHCDRACDIFRERCTGVHWERNTASAFGLWALSHMGEIAELGRRWPRLLAEARDRGDLYAVMNLSTYLLSIVRLAADEPDLARDEVGQAMAHWSRGGYHVQHNDQAWGMAQIELYAGRGGAAWDLITWNWPALSRSLLLRVQFIRVAMWQLRPRCAWRRPRVPSSPSPCSTPPRLTRGGSRARRRLGRWRRPG